MLAVKTVIGERDANIRVDKGVFTVSARRLLVNAQLAAKTISMVCVVTSNVVLIVKSP